MIINSTAGFKRKVKKLIKRYPPLRNKLKVQFKQLQLDPTHPGLRFHKLKGERSEQYAMWIYGDLRALAIKDEDNYIFFDILTHDEY